MDPRQFQIEYGGASKPGVYDPAAEGWTDYRTLPEVVSQLGSMLYQPYYFPGRFIRNFKDYMSQSLAGNPSRFINPVDPEYTPSIYAEPSPTPSVDSGGVGGVFAGERSLLANLNMKKIAERALAAGKDPDEVRRVTGWFKGMEDKFRFEIDDSAMKLRPEFADGMQWQKGEFGAFKVSGERTLPEVIDHPALFESYPALKNTKVAFDHPRATGASFDSENNVIHLPSRGLELGMQSSVRDSLSHEIQHWVQKQEGFARGGNFQQMGEETYSKLAGEIEARDVSARRTWDRDMREMVPPTLREDAIIRWGGKDADEIFQELVK